MLRRKKKEVIEEEVVFSEEDELEALKEVKARIHQLRKEGKKPKEIFSMLKTENNIVASP